MSKGETLGLRSVQEGRWGEERCEREKDLHFEALYDPWYGE